MKLLKWLIFTGFFCSIILAILAYPYRRRIANKVFNLISYYSGRPLRGSGSCEGCSKNFTDNVETHQLAYEKEGIKPQRTFSDLEKLHQKGKLKELKSTDRYIVRKLKYSRPYILPEGERFIQELAQSYYDRCLAYSIEFVPFTISSLTRTKDSVEDLMETNGNAIENSAHLMGKTLDISYRAFNDNKRQNKLFIEVLDEMRLANKCYVKFERNGCLHITVI